MGHSHSWIYLYMLNLTLIIEFWSKYIQRPNLKTTISSCSSFWPFALHPLKLACSDPLPISWLDCLLCWCWASWTLHRFWILILHKLQNLLFSFQVFWLSIHWLISITLQKLPSLMQYRQLVSSLIACSWVFYKRIFASAYILQHFSDVLLY